ncbi:MAG: (2Fe-2S)-binding protein [Chitinophagaceae bacterium]|nr:(2Fe-2S)-binding protein [Chitinophagaceae bacterium]
MSNAASSSKQKHTGRRLFIKKAVALTALSASPPLLIKAGEQDEFISSFFEKKDVNLNINGKTYSLSIEPRTTLLDLLREQLGLTGTKKGCDHGQCGCCTVHIEGKPVYSCLVLAVMQEGKKITTIEGLAQNENLHPVQKAFLKHDGFQCGFCTPGQIMNAVACVKNEEISTYDQIKEFMSGNLCRCGAYPNIIDAIMDVKKQGGAL